MKIYLAGPMTGIEEHNFPMFDHVAWKLRQEGHEVYNPADLTRQRWGTLANFVKLPEKEKQEGIEWLLSKELTWICLQAEAVYLLPGWENSKGANAEKCAAEALGKPVRFASTGLEDVCIIDTFKETPQEV